MKLQAAQSLLQTVTLATLTALPYARYAPPSSEVHPQALSLGPARQSIYAPPISPASSLLDEIISRGYLKVGMAGDYKPFTYLAPPNFTHSPSTTSTVANPMANSTFIGSDVDMARDLSASLGLTQDVRFIHTTWGSLSSDISVTPPRYDIAMGGISITLSRALKGFYSVPTRRGGKVATVRCEDVDKYGSLSAIDQPGVKVIVNPGGTNEAFDRAHLRRANITVWSDNTQVFQRVAEGLADVMITDDIEAELQSNLHGGVLCAVNPTRPFDFSEKAYFLPKDVPWKLFVDTWLHMRLEDGTWNATYQQWMHYPWPLV